MALHITLYLFDQQDPRVEVSALNQRVEFHSNTIRQMDKTCNELWSGVDLLMDKANHLGKK